MDEVTICVSPACFLWGSGGGFRLSAGIGAVEIVACVAGDETTQIVKAFGNYIIPMLFRDTVDLQSIGKWLGEHGTLAPRCGCSAGVKTVAMESLVLSLSKYWHGRALNVC